ncbi:hypothetical protein MaudCBS49596_007788 [Microsporum audouinii]
MADRVIDFKEGSAWGAGDSDTITLSRDEALALAQSQTNYDRQKAELERTKEELREHFYFSQLGDYAGRVVDWVMNSTAKKNDLPSTVSKLRGALAKEISTNPERDGNVCAALEDSIRAISSRGLSVDFDMVQLAINAYDDRNTAFHSTLRTVADDLDGLGRQVEKDQNRLLRLLPNEEYYEHIESWRKIIDFYTQSQKLSFNENTRRKLRDIPVEDVRQLASADRINAFENGKFCQSIVQEPDVAKSRQRINSDPTSESVLTRKRRTSGSLGPGSTESAGHARGKARRRLTKHEEKFIAESGMLVNRINDWHDKSPRPALKWVKDANQQLEKEGK